MDFDDLVAVVNRLDESVSKENAKVRLNQYGGDGDDGCIIATQTGYLRFGIELLKAGTAPAPAEKSIAIDVDIGYLIDDDSSISISTFERVEVLDAETNEHTWGDSLFIYAIIGVLIAMPILSVVGLIALVRLFL